MIRAKSCFVAEGVITDSDTNQISAFGLIENLQAENYPLTLQKLAFFCLWVRDKADPDSTKCEFSITLNGRDIVRQSVEIGFRQHLHSRTTIRIDGFALSEPGLVVFRLAVPGHDGAEWTLEASRTAVSAPIGSSPAESGPGYDFGQVTVSLGKVNVHRR